MSLPSLWNNWFVGLCEGEASFTFHCDASSKSARPRFKLCLQGDTELLREIHIRFRFGSEPREFTPKATRNGKGYKPRAEWGVYSAHDCLKLVEFFGRHPLRSRKRLDFQIWSELVTEAVLPKPNRRKLNEIALQLSSNKTSGRSQTALTTLRGWLAKPSGDGVEFIPVRPIQQMRGFLRGMDTTVERDEDRL
jgi:hypothetical protein